MRYALALLASAPFFGATAGAAPTPPHLKAGLWEQTQTMSGMPVNVPPMNTRFCTDAAVQARVNMFATGSTAGRECSAPRITPQGDGFTVDVACQGGHGMSSTMHAVVHGDFSSNFTSDTTMSFSGMPAGAPAGMPPTMVAHSTARYAGACPTGMRPGDFVVNGRTFNVLDSMAKSHP